MNHAKLVNLRPERVQWEFVSTKLTPERRKQFSVDDAQWRDVNEPSAWLKQKMVDLLRDWDAFLDVALYREAITHFLGGEDAVVRPVSVFSDNRLIGEQEMHMLTEDTAFAISAVHDSTEGMKVHQLRFLHHTPLRHIQWINLNRHRIEFVTLSAG